MPRVVSILVSLLVLYGSAAWAMAGCEALQHALTTDRHESGHVQHGGHGDGDHSHSDPAAVHCPDLFGAFLITARVTGHSQRDTEVSLLAAAFELPGSAPIGAFHGFGVGPPGPIFFLSPPRYLKFSSLRI
jgi:hypothetical protein